MPPREPAPRTKEDHISADFDHEMMRIEDRLVSEAGDPPDSTRLSERELDELWALRDPSIDYDTLAPRLMTEGLPVEEAQALAVVKLLAEVGYDWLPLYGQATQDAEKANQLAHLAEFPMRAVLLLDMDPDEQVALAERLQVRYERTHGGASPSEPADAPLPAAGVSAQTPAVPSAPDPGQMPPPPMGQPPQAEPAMPPMSMLGG